MVTIGVAGKGGTGKTTLAGLIIRTLLDEGKKPVLAIDADPNSNLNEVLGVPAPSSLVQIVDEISKVKENIPSGMDKTRYLEFRVRESIRESEGFDLMLMGKTEGPGCYCYANHLLRDYVEKLSKNYSFVVMDNEAGMEHLSRRTSRDMDVLFITMLADRIALRSAERIYGMLKTMDLNIKKTYLVINEFGGNRLPADCAFFIPPLFSVPYDEMLIKSSEEGTGVLKIREDSPAYQAVRKHLLPLL